MNLTPSKLPPLLVPRPLRIRDLGGRVRLPVRLNPKALLALNTGRAAEPSGPPVIDIKLTGAACGTSAVRLQSYELKIAPPRFKGDPSIRISAPTPAGARLGLATLAQLLRQYGDELPALEIDDEPSFPTRGLMLDISRDRVPTMAQLRETVDLMSELKLNHLQLYTEHTFAYIGHEDVWRGWSPVTHAEVRALDSYCKLRGIELAANQNCFGHLAHWLRMPRYAHLAETQGDWMFDVWPRSGPFSLCPTDPASARFVEELLAQLLPCFTSPLVNIGADETYDIAYGRSRSEVDRRGRAAVYLDFLKELNGLVRKHGKRAMYWGDIILSHPELVRQIPEDMISLAWGYEPDSPFKQWADVLAEAGREFWVAPGTSSWRSITGRTRERRLNINAAAAAGSRAGATGFLLCDWGDTGHHQQWPIVLNAIAHGAHAAWNAPVADTLDAGAVSLQAFEDESLTLSPWIGELGNVDLRLRETCGALSRPDLAHLRNQSALFIDMFKALDEQTEVGDQREWARIPDRVDELALRRPRSGVQQLDDELAHTVAMASFAARRGSWRRRLAGLSDAQAQTLRADLDSIIAEHRRLWLLRSREGGLDHSCSFFEKIGTSLGARP